VGRPFWRFNIMASVAHLELVRLGADAIAEWRENQTPGERSGLDLSGATLRGVQLRGLDLEFADLSGVMAGSADFSRSNLRYSKMTRANLVDGDLSDASCEGTDLSGARLRGAKLGRTNLRGADLREANLVDAFLPWVLPVVNYSSPETLLQALKEQVIAPADDMARRLMQRLDNVRRPSSPQS
jgi:uncharacterized protein YjbI with pentapeptide repeats